MIVVEIKDGNFACVKNEEELIDDVVRGTCGDDVADKLTEYIEYVKSEGYTYEEYQEIESEKEELEEENERLKAAIETYKQGKNPFEDQLNEIQDKLFWISQNVADLQRVSKSKKVEDARVNILQKINNLQNVIEEIKG